MKWIRLPHHEVELSASPVSWQEYVVFARETGRPQPSRHGAPQDPVLEVSATNARAFAAWMALRKGNFIRLPTREEMALLMESAQNGAVVRFGRPNKYDQALLGVDYLEEWLDSPSTSNDVRSHLWSITDPGWLLDKNTHIQAAIADFGYHFITFRLARCPGQKTYSHDP